MYVLHAACSFNAREEPQEWLDWSWLILLFLPELIALGWIVLRIVTVKLSDQGPDNNKKKKKKKKNCNWTFFCHHTDTAAAADTGSTQSPGLGSGGDTNDTEEAPTSSGGATKDAEEAPDFCCGPSDVSPQWDLHRYFIDFLGLAAVFLGTLRDDGFALFAATSTGILFILVRGTDDPVASQVGWIMSNPLLLLIASIDVWLTRFDKAALDRIVKHVPFVTKKAETAGTFLREATPDLEDISVRNGLRAANLLRTRFSARFFWHLAAFVQNIGAIAFALPLADLGGRLSGVDQRGMDILRMTTAVYGALSSLVGTMRLHRTPTFTFTVRDEGGGFSRKQTQFFGARVWRNPQSPEAKLLLRMWTLGVDWLAVRVGLVIMCDEEFAYFEDNQIDDQSRLRLFYPY